LITLGLFGGFVSLLVAYLLVLANLSRTPWNKTMYVELDRLFQNQIQEGGEEGELPTTTGNNSRLNICERCGTSASIRELFSGRGGSIVLCAGCVGYKLMLRFMPGLMFLLPSSFLCWYFGIGSSLYLPELFSGIGMLMMVGVGLMMLIWNRPVFPFIIACRPTPDQNEEGDHFQRLQRVLDPQSTQLLNSSSISESHCKSLQGILQDEEEILWIQRVPFSIFIKRHYDLQLLVWSFIAVPAMWGSIGLLSLLYERSITDIAFGVWVTIFVLVFSTPYIVAAVLKCKVTYVLTNLRAMRINSTILFNTRVYSFPYHRMELLYILNLPDSPTSIPTTAMAPSSSSTPPDPTGEVSKGKVGWSLWPDEDSFSTLEFVANTVEGTYLPLLSSFCSLSHVFSSFIHNKKSGTPNNSTPSGGQKCLCFNTRN
jgi:hypothetical protein